jgi:hypothetical protein
MPVKLILAALLAAPALPAAALAAGPTAVAPASDADRLVALLAPDAMVTQLARRMFDNNVQKADLLSAKSKARLGEDAAFKKQVADAVGAEMTRILPRELPALRTRMSALLAREMTAPEIAETLRFFGTPTGRKMLAQIYRGIGESGATTEEQAQQAAMSALMASLTPEDYPALIAFTGSPAAAKLQSLNPRIKETSRAWALDFIARYQPVLVQVAEKAASGYRGEEK